MAEYICCEIQFSTEEALTRHQVQTHGTQRPPAGSCCGIDFYTEEGLEEHRRVHHGRRG